jgi:hypothetical protein
MAEKFELGMRSFMKDSPEEVVDYVRAKMARGEPLVGVYVLEDQLIIDVLKNDRLGEAVDEAARAGMDCYRDAFGPPTDSFRREIALVCDIVYNSFIPAHREAPEELSITSGYDLLAWIANNYDKPLSDYELAEPKPIGLKIRGLDAHQTVWTRDDSPDDKYQRAFAVINSANRRRALVAPSPRAEAVKSPVYGMTYGFAQDVQRVRPDLGTGAG